MCKCPLSLLPWVLGLASAGLLAYAGYTTWDESLVPAIRVEEPDLVLENAKVGENTVEYIVINEGSEPIRLLGAETHCFAGCCFGPSLEELPTVPPGGRVAVPFKAYVRKAGEKFSAESKLFLHWRGDVIPVKVTISGIATTGAKTTSTITQ